MSRKRNRSEFDSDYLLQPMIAQFPSSQQPKNEILYYSEQQQQQQQPSQQYNIENDYSAQSSLMPNFSQGLSADYYTHFSIQIIFSSFTRDFRRT